MAKRSKGLLKKKDDAKGVWFARLFFLFFASIGFFFFWIVVVLPLSRVCRAQSWVATPCVIERSEVRTHSSSDGATYSIAIIYAYEFKGEPHHGERYNFSFGSSSGSKGKRTVVAKYPAGSQATCFVNPRDPEQAVISRAVPRDIWFGLIPIPFMFIGVGGLLGMGRGGRETQRRDALGRKLKPAKTVFKVPNPAMSRRNAQGYVTLASSERPIGRLIGITFFALIWNGIVSIFVIQVAKSWIKHVPEYFLTLFLVPFVLIGLLTIFGIFYYFLALFNPKPIIELEGDSIPLGGEAKLRWRIDGNMARLRNLRIELIGRESATYRRGTNSHTDHSLFERLVLFEGTERREIAMGDAKIMISRETMHTFDGPNNKIEWKLRVQGEISRWPDVKFEYPLIILPNSELARIAMTDQEESPA